MGTLQADTEITQTEERFQATLSRNWEIWGPNGGYVAAVALRAAGLAAPSDHRPTSLSCQFISVAEFGEIEVQVVPIKQGRSAWLIEVSLVQKGAVFLKAQVWTTNRAGGPRHLGHEMPAGPPPLDLPSTEERLGPTPSKLWANFEVRPVYWVQPGEPHPEGAALTEWFRYVDFETPTDPFLDCARGLILCDLLVWPAHHRGLVERPTYIAPSLDLTVWFHEPPGDADWLLCDIRADVAGEGLIQGGARIWSQDGRLLATSGTQMLVSQRK
jgi:acyl-CoA thioesterase II